MLVLNSNYQVMSGSIFLDSIKANELLYNNFTHNNML